MVGLTKLNTRTILKYPFTVISVRYRSVLTFKQLNAQNYRVNITPYLKKNLKIFHEVPNYLYNK